MLALEIRKPYSRDPSKCRYSPFELDQEGPEGVIPVARELGAT